MSFKKEDQQIKAYMGQDMIFKGSLTFQGTVRIDGKFEGDVVTEDTLIVGETGLLSGEITAGTVICKGKIQGTVVASNKIEIHANSEMLGNIKAPSLYVEVGGVFDGNCDMVAGDSKIIQLKKGDEKEASQSG